MTIEIERTSVLTIDIPESFNMFYWQDTDVSGSNPQFTHTCIRKYSVWLRIDKELAYGNTRRLRFETQNECRSEGNEITFLEHVEIEVSLEYSLRGALQMYLTAPSGMHFSFVSTYLVSDICLYAMIHSTLGDKKIYPRK